LARREKDLKRPTVLTAAGKGRKWRLKKKRDHKKTKERKKKQKYGTETGLHYFATGVDFLSGEDR